MLPKELNRILEAAASIMETIEEDTGIKWVPANEPPEPPIVKAPQETEEREQREHKDYKESVESKRPKDTQKRESNRQQLKKMILHKEILDKPLSMREERGR